MAKEKEKKDITVIELLIGILAILVGFTKGLSDGVKPPPGDRRG